MTARTRLLVLIVTTPILGFVLIGGFVGTRASAGGQTEQNLRVFEDVLSLIIHNYVEEVNTDKVMTGAMRGLADGLDPDSAFLEPEQARAVETNQKIADGDVGIELTRQYYLRIIAPRDGSPAARAGLQAGDFIRAIDSKPTRDISVFEGTRMLRGAPGTKVSLLVIRGNAADPREITLTRETPSIPPVNGRLIDGNVGYIRVPTFDGDAAGAIASEVNTLTKAGATKLIVDVRRTAEGPLQKGLDAAGLFVPAGTTLAVRAARDQAKQPTLSQAKGQAIALPTLVLVNFGTSGPAELFAAALADNGRAKLVGERTNGRTGLQKLVPLPQGHALWLTYATYLSPKGEAIHEKGLKPAVTAEEEDIELGAPVDPNAKDPILEKALQSFGS